MVDEFGASLDEVLSAFGPAAGKLSPMPEPFSDFWGVVTDFKLHRAEFEDAETKEVRITPMLRMEILVDNGPSIWEDFPLPIDRQTGEIRRTPEGGIARANEESKWGKQEDLLVSNGLTFGDARDLIGLHSHFKRMEIPLKGRGNRVTKGRFIIEWDGYNNAVRSEHGLKTLTAAAFGGTVAETTEQQAAPTNGKVASATAALGEESAIELLVETGTFMKYLSAAKQRELKLEPSWLTRAAVDTWVDAGYVSYDSENRQYKRGEKYEEVFA